MKKPIEKQPIDELFARKLGNMSLPTKADGFERLQARMGQGKPEMHTVFWRNPTVQQYTAAAACLLLICLFGWLYWPSGSDFEGEQVADNNPVAHPAQNDRQVQVAQQSANIDTVSDVKTPFKSTSMPLVQHIAKVDKQPGISNDNQLIKATKRNARNVATIRNETVLAQVQPVLEKQDAVRPNVVLPTHQPTSDQLAENKTEVKPTPAAERVLVVTIAEPEALSVARQAVTTEEKTVVAAADKPEKANKSTSLWQQVKRIKQGEVLARGDNSDTESSLLGRAYSGLKHSLDKDKSVKQ